MSKQPNIPVQSISQLPSKSSQLKGSGSVERVSTPLSGGTDRGSSGPSTFVLA